MSARLAPSVRFLGLGLAIALVLGPAPLAAADEPPATDDVAGLIADLLAELGFPPDATDPVIADLLDGVTERIDDLVERGIVEPDQVEELASRLDQGELDEAVAELVEQTRERRDAVRAASEALLAELGVEVPEEGSLHDAIAAAGLTRDDLAELLEESGVELPPPPDRPRPADPCAADEGEPGTDPCPTEPERTTPRAAPTTTRPPAPPTTTTPPATTVPPTTTQPPTGYPEQAPTPAPAPAYPEQAPATGSTPPPPPPPPQPDYPSTGGAEPAPEEQL